MVNPSRPRHSSEMAAKAPVAHTPPNLRMISANVDIAYDDAVASFKERPSADNYMRLNSAMLALQYWRGLMPGRREEAAAVLWAKSIGSWTETLVARQKADFNSATE